MTKNDKYNQWKLSEQKADAISKAQNGNACFLLHENE